MRLCGLGLGSAEPAEPATCSSAAEPSLTLTSPNPNPGTCSEGLLLQLFAYLGGGPAPTLPMHGGAGGVTSGRAAAGRLPIDWSEQAAYMHARGLTRGFAQVWLGLGLELGLG